MNKIQAIFIKLQYNPNNRKQADNVSKTVQTAKPLFVPKIRGYYRVDNYLIRGGAPSVRNLIALKKEGVNQIYDFRHSNKRGLKFIEAIVAKLLGMDYRRRKFSFFTNQGPKLADFEEVAAAIKQNGKKGGKTLLHCNSGRHRTGQMVAFYELTHGETLAKTKDMYPRTYPLRAKILLDRLKNDGNYFSRSYIENLSMNPIKRMFQKRNNKVFESTKRAFDDFNNILLK